MHVARFDEGQKVLPNKHIGERNRTYRNRFSQHAYPRGKTRRVCDLALPDTPGEKMGRMLDEGAVCET